MKLYGLEKLIEDGKITYADFDVKNIGSDTKPVNLLYFNWAKALKIFVENGGSYANVDFDGQGKFWQVVNGSISSWQWDNAKRKNVQNVVHDQNQCLVYVDVTLDGQTLRSFLPVTDGKNVPIANPSVFDLNTTKQRCLVKAIAEISGLGLELWADKEYSKELGRKVLESRGESKPEASSTPFAKSESKPKTTTKKSTTKTAPKRTVSEVTEKKENPFG